MTGADDILIAREGAGLALTLNRPDKRNAVSWAMWRALPELLAEAADAPNVAALVVTGAGGAFAAGADISEFETVYASEQSAQDYSAAVARALDALAAFPKPTVAKIRGACVGGGCAIALACDLRFAAEDARFGVTPAKLGLVYPFNDLKRLVDAVGSARAKDMVFTGRLLDAAQAHDFGLVERVLSVDSLDAAVADYVGSLAAASRHTQRVTKAMIALMRDGLDADNAETQRWFAEAFRGPDFDEGRRAFLEKRAPAFCDE